MIICTFCLWSEHLFWVFIVSVDFILAFSELCSFKISEWKFICSPGGHNKVCTWLSCSEVSVSRLFGVPAGPLWLLIMRVLYLDCRCIDLLWRCQGRCLGWMRMCLRLFALTLVDDPAIFSPQAVLSVWTQGTLSLLSASGKVSLRGKVLSRIAERKTSSLISILECKRGLKHHHHLHCRSWKVSLRNASFRCRD